MKTAGIIAEYNPFHLGHQYQLAYIRRIYQADYLVIAMSGDYVQRGTPALLPKHIRAEMALRSGADLVLELPVSVSCSSAEFFARGGVSLLDGLGVVDMLCFGSEEGELPLFLETAKLLLSESPEYKTVLQTCLKNGMSFPSARTQALLSCFRHTEPELTEARLTEFLSSPNNILGIEYCKALLSQNSSIAPATLKRKGSGYHEALLDGTKMPSAAGIRRALRSRAALPDAALPADVQAALPKASFALLADAFSRNAYLTEADLDLLVHYCLLGNTWEGLCQYQDVSETLAKRIVHLTNRFTGFQEFAQLLKTKELTQTRIQRALLHVLLRIREAPGAVPYARVLGFRKDAGPLLQAIKKEGKLPLLTKLADAQKLLDPDAQKLLDETSYASNLYESILCHKTGQTFRHEYEKPLVII